MVNRIQVNQNQVVPINEILKVYGISEKQARTLPIRYVVSLVNEYYNMIAKKQ